MFENVFYFSMLFFIILLVVGLVQRSAAVMALAAIFSILLGIALTGEGIEYATGWNIEGATGDDVNITKTYTLHSAETSTQVAMWQPVLFWGGWVWLIVAFLFAVKGRQGDLLEET